MYCTAVRQGLDYHCAMFLPLQTTCLRDICRQISLTGVTDKNSKQLSSVLSHGDVNVQLRRASEEMNRGDENSLASSSSRGAARIPDGRVVCCPRTRAVSVMDECSIDKTLN